jgi:hypothetical protein
MTTTIEPEVGATAAERPIERFAGYFDLAFGAIGRVAGSEKEPAGSHQFFIWATDEAVTLDVGHIVITTSEEAVVIGVVDEPRRFSDLRTFLDDFYDRHLDPELIEGEAMSRRPEILVFSVTVLATRHLRDDVVSNRPPIAGPVYFATPEAIEYALGKENFSGVPIPALLHTNGNPAYDKETGEVKRDANGNVVFQTAPIWLDEEYLLGPEAGHANWTGQSGLATKTSHAMFLTSAVMQRLRKEGKRVAALMFNVKGPDLLWLDKPADPAEGDEDAYRAVEFKGLSQRDRDAYAALGLEPKPFEHLTIFAPFKPMQVPPGGSDGAVHLASERNPGALNTLRTKPGEAACVYPILWSLDRLLAQPHRIFERNDLDDKLFGFISELRDQKIATISAFTKLNNEIEAYFQATDESGRAPSDWRGHHQFTIKKAKNRILGLGHKFGGLLTDGAVDYSNVPRVDQPFTDQEVRVVDIAHCNTQVQDVLVNSTINEIWKLAEREQLGVDKLIVFVDELNKYAPSGGEGGLRDTLVDIAARGRHLKVVLFGAQQFRSKVEGEILGNCGTSFYGRIGDEEIINASYRSLSETTKAELLGLRKGKLLVRHAHFRAPLFGDFPHPPTIPGMKGQSVFNGDAGVTRANEHAGDGLHHLMKKLMGTSAPSLTEVRTETDGFDPAVIHSICVQVEQAWERRRDTSGGRISPWSSARNMLRQNASSRIVNRNGA